MRGASNGIYERYAMNQVSKMRKLTDKQTALIDTLVANGCTIGKAAEMAGYAAGESGRVTASKA